MGLRVNAAAQRRLNAIRSQLLAARLAARVSQEALSEALSVTSRSLRDWERGYDSPSLTHAFDWAQRLAFRLVLTDRLAQAPTAPAAAPVEAKPHPAWQMREYRLLAPLLKARRRARKISQTDLGLIVGVTRSTLQRWEDGEQLPRLIALIVWADRLDYTVELQPLL